ncbi:GGDEF domain-containing protein [Simiduia sp. 21SJ11W-1]|uniref:GGDEF domain-containing protein n=1 Tax=Simiduia sp. 21SJ11W-1 TaxID=2909669 RepID=UPI0020A1F3A3|nr:GGDEF domain-containing protein [Simiduia sp. 21SJ11W-1]UTA47742.1 GGDEF domain-containing protein [Simiduia sp. 21SJ11W-1]
MASSQPLSSVLDDSLQLRLRLWRDVVKRARPGIMLYPMLWLVISYSTQLMATRPVFSWAMMALLVATSALRWVNSRALGRAIVANFRWWQLGLYAGVLAHSIIWGSLFAYSLTMGQAEFLFLMAFSSAGMVAGGSNSFSPVKALSYSYILTFILPSFFVSVWALDSWGEAALIATYVFYMLNLARQQHREYWRSLKNELTLEKQSRTDALTSLSNRRYFDEKLNELCHLSSRDHVQLAVLVVDCDHFKEINDQYGHDFGDECLRQLGGLLTESLPRATDVCARYGGEEFSIILAGTDLAGAQKVAERIRARVAEHEVRYRGQATHITVSIGLTSERLEKYRPELPEQLFKRADVALYRAKRAGRNCVRSADIQYAGAEQLDAEASV